VFDIIGKRRWFYVLSLAITIPGLLFILMTPITGVGLQFSIDYTGGTRWVVRFENPDVTPEQVEAVFAEQGLTASVVRANDGYLDIRTQQVVGLRETPPPTPSPSPSSSASPGASASPAASPSPSASASTEPSPSPSATPIPGNTEIPTEGQLGEVARALEAELGDIESQTTLTSIGAVVSGDLIRQALILIVVGSIGIMLWMTYRFRDVKFGATALVALVHDVVLVVGLFAFLGTVAGVHIDALFVTAMLTVIGFSVHDTIVVYDRVRENRARHAGEPFVEIVNHSILQTIGRSITTSLTVVVTLLALLLFGGAAINDFILALLIGIVSGTYSSIFVASPLLVDWHAWEDRRHGRVQATRGPRVRRATP
jgi:preprotein translocase subunit SecF